MNEDEAVPSSCMVRLDILLRIGYVFALTVAFLVAYSLSYAITSPILCIIFICACPVCLCKLLQPNRRYPTKGEVGTMQGPSLSSEIGSRKGPAVLLIFAFPLLLVLFILAVEAISVLIAAIAAAPAATYLMVGPCAHVLRIAPLLPFKQENPNKLQGCFAYYSWISRVGLAALWVSVWWLPCVALSLALFPVGACLLCPLLVCGHFSLPRWAAICTGLLVGGGLVALCHLQWELSWVTTLGVGMGAGWGTGLLIAPPISHEAWLAPVWLGAMSPAIFLLIAPPPGTSLSCLATGCCGYRFPDLHNYTIGQSRELVPFGPVPYGPSQILHDLFQDDD